MEYLTIGIGALVLVLCIICLCILAKMNKSKGRETGEILAKLDALAHETSEKTEQLEQEIEDLEHRSSDKLTALETKTGELGRYLAVVNEKTGLVLGKFDNVPEKPVVAEEFRELKKGQNETREQLLSNQMNQQKELFETLNRQTENTLKTVTEALDNIRRGNEQKLDEMRQTVDEKLSKTLNDSLSNSFRTVTEQLQQVYNSLGQMKGLADDVGQLQKALNNVKTRGTFGEVQLGSILEQTLAPNQYETNFSPRNNAERVEYAVKIPSKDNDEQIVYLPIDAKFPQEDYLRIQEASESGDRAALDGAVKALARNIKESGKKISSLYLEVPKTTSFAVMFLPTEGLYAEVLRIPGLVEDVQRDYHVMICGPTTVTAFLNTLSVGFRTIAIDRQAGNIMKLLEATKAQYETFCKKIADAKSKIEKAGDAIDSVEKCAGQINKKLKTVAQIDEGEAGKRLELEADPFEIEGN